MLVVSAVDGVEVGTEAAWRRCAARGIPRLVFVNKEDKPRADFHRTLDQLRATFGNGFVPLELPLGEEEKLHGVADVLTDEGLEYETDGTHHSEPLPADVADEEHRLHDEVVEEIVAGDDEQLERYLSGEVPSAAELERTLAGEMLHVRRVSRVARVGDDRRGDRSARRLHLPARSVARRSTDHGGRRHRERARPGRRDGQRRWPTCSRRSPTSSSVRSRCSRSCLARSTATTGWSTRTTSTEERMHGLFHLRGKEHLTVNHIVAGDLGGIAKLAATPSHSTLAAKGSPVRVEPPVAPSPNYQLALEPVTQSDDDKLSDSLNRLVSEDPDAARRALRGDPPDRALWCRRHARRRRLGAPRPQVRGQRVHRRGQGSLPRDDLGQRRRRGQGQEAERRTRAVRRRQHARRTHRAWLRVSEFVDKIVGGAIPRNFLPAVQKGVEETMATGGAFGFPVVDVKVECYDGKYHSVDSSDMAFRTAASLGLKEALAKASPVVLEPVSLLTVTVPESMQGDVLGDINSRRGRVSGSNPLGDGHIEITAMVPAGEIQRYAVDLRSMTGGRGSFEAVHDHYDVLPQHLTSKLVAERSKAS